MKLCTADFLNYIPSNIYLQQFIYDDYITFFFYYYIDYIVFSRVQEEKLLRE